jgi:hypothetical protein
MFLSLVLSVLLSHVPSAVLDFVNDKESLFKVSRPSSILSELFVQEKV